MRGETTFIGQRIDSQREAVEFILKIMIDSMSHDPNFTLANLLFNSYKGERSKRSLKDLYDILRQVAVLLYKNSSNKSRHEDSIPSLCYNKLLYVEGDNKLVGTITWFSTAGSGAFVRIVYGTKTTFAIYDTGYITDEFGKITERGLSREGDIKSDKDQANFLSYALSVSQDPKWQG
jgi:hypothetical protein